MIEEKEKSFEKKQELIDAAIKEFGERGYEKASLNNILKESGISKGTFYYHFKNKEDLYMYLIEIFIVEKKKSLAKYIQPEDFTKDFFTILKLLVKAGLMFAKENPQINKFSETYLKDYNSAINQKMLKKYNPEANDYFNGIIEMAYGKGEFREDLPKDFVKQMVTYLFTHLQEITNVLNIEDYESAADHLISFMQTGLMKKHT